MRSALSIILFLTSLLISAQSSIPSEINAMQTSEVRLDGKLNDSIWQKAVRITNFTQRELTEGEPVSERTEVAMAYDKDYLYVAVWCYDSEPDKIMAKEMKRDFDYDLDDNFILIFDTYNDKRNGFMFVTNPNAARADIQVFSNGGSENAYWNAVWDVRTSRSAEGWFAEFKIPFYSLRFRPTDKIMEWGVNFERNIRRKREQALWQGWSRDNSIQKVNQAGKLTGISLHKAKRFIEVKPYVIGGVEQTGDWQNRYNVGGDVNYLLNPSYRLNVTLNTDFAQVESDRQQINLTRFPLFFPELREFFLEGQDYFDMGYGGDRIIPFYSRRIGLDEDRNAVPILAGARLLGKENDRTVGLMSIQTAETESQATTNYTVGSWRQDLGKQSLAGVMTANTFSEGRWYNSTGFNARYSTAKFLKNKNLDVGGAFIHSYASDTTFDPKAFAFRSYLYYLNDKMTVVATVQRSPKPFEAELGLMTRRNFNEVFFLWGLSPRPKKYLKWIRQYDFAPVKFTQTNYDDTREIQSFEYALKFLGFETKSGENIGIEYNYVGEGLIDSFQIIPDATIPEGLYWWQGWKAYASTFEGRTLSMASTVNWGGFFEGDIFKFNTSLNWRASKYVNVALEYEHNDIALKNFSPFTTNLFTSRIQYNITPNAFGSLFGQWNSNQEQFNVNFRLQLIPKLGADLFFIVNQLYDTSGNGMRAERTTLLTKLIWRFVL